MNAETYGSAPTMLGGMGLFLSVWKESATSIFTEWNGLPRGFVVAAIKETQRHPGILNVPIIQRRLTAIQHTLTDFRSKDLSWYVEYAEIIGGLLADEEARQIWSPIIDRAANATVVAKACRWKCRTVVEEMRVAEAAAKPWRQVMDFRRIPASDILNASTGLIQFYSALQTLHNVTGLHDVRIQQIMKRIPALVTGYDYWRSLLFRSLLVGDVWAMCIQHMKMQDTRIHEILVLSGFQELQHVHERILNASLHGLSDATRRTVMPWFEEAAHWSWWLSDDIPLIVKRCALRNSGDCALIGPTEITSLVNRAAEGRRIADDWLRCILIGLWNALPVVGIIFCLELMVAVIVGCRVPRYEPIQLKKSPLQLGTDEYKQSNTFHRLIEPRREEIPERLDE